MAAKKKARTAKQKAASKRNIKKAQTANRGGKPRKRSSSKKRSKPRKKNPVRVAAINPKKKPAKKRRTGGQMKLFGDLKVGKRVRVVRFKG